jgi:hypothetical protein
MSKTTRLEQVEQECKQRGIRLIYDDLRSEGGLCRLRGNLYLIMSRRLACETRVRVITEALARAQAMLASRPVAAEQEAETPAAIPEPVAVPLPLATPRPEPQYEEPGVGVPVAAGVPDSQS